MKRICIDYVLGSLLISFVLQNDYKKKVTSKKVEHDRPGERSPE